VFAFDPTDLSKVLIAAADDFLRRRDQEDSD